MNRTSSSIVLLYLVVLGLVGLLCWRTWRPAHESDDSGNVTTKVVTPRGDLAEDEKATIELFKQASPAVVHIQSLTLRRDLFSLNIQRIPQGTGTGFVWDEKGHIVTNYHVVKGAREVRVTLADHSTWKAYQVRYDEYKDLAVVWTDAPHDRLKSLLLGESSKVQVGQKAFAIGNPFGLDQTLTTGIISALNREIESEGGRTIQGVLQTDAAINPGNSGGPLLDSAGRLIGVNTAILSPSGTYAGIGFAIPSDEVNRVITRLLKNEKTARPGLGIEVVPDQVTRKRGIEGVVILNVLEGGPAERAKLRPTERDPDTGRIIWGDVIKGIDDHPVKTTDELSEVLVDNYQVGQEVTVTYRRGQNEMKAKLRLTADVR